MRGEIDASTRPGRRTAQSASDCGRAPWSYTQAMKRTVDALSAGRSRSSCCRPRTNDRAAAVSVRVGWRRSSWPLARRPEVHVPRHPIPWTGRIGEKTLERLAIEVSVLRMLLGRPVLAADHVVVA